MATMGKWDSKYNNKQSIPIRDIPKKDIYTAIREWSQGDYRMEKVLIACFENDIETQGSHPGLNQMYIEFVVENKNRDKLIKLLNGAQKIDGSGCFLRADAGNPLGGRKFYDPIISLTIMKSDEITENDYDVIYDSIIGEPDSSEQIFSYILDFYDLLAGKGYDLNINIGHTSENHYNLYIHFGEYRENEINKLLNSGIGLQKLDRSFSLFCEDSKEFVQKIEELKAFIKKEFTLSFPTKIEDGMSYGIVARIKMLEFGETEEGKQKFEAWINKYKQLSDLERFGKISFDDFNNWIYNGIEPDFFDNKEHLADEGK